MTLFEYLAIAYSLILSSAAMRLIGGLSSATRPGARYSIHLGAIAMSLLAVAMMFWAFWSYREVDWTLPRFFGLLAQLGVLYFSATALVPEEPGGVESWRDHYYSVRTRYYGAVAATGALIALNTTLLLGMPIDHPGRLTQLAMFGFGALGASTDDPRVHGAIVGLGIVLTPVFIFTVMLVPGSLST